MPVLALDTSAAVAVAVTADDGAVLAARSVPEGRHHAELLAPLVRDVLADAGLGMREVTTVVVGTGPAPFTGLRVGLVTARTFGAALGVPVLGVPSLDALALRALAAGTQEEVVVATDARRREVYWARYRRAGAGDVEAVAGPAVGPAADALAAVRPAGAALVGRGVLLDETLRAALAEDPDPALLDPDPAALAALALARAAAGRDQPTEPLYLRRPDAVPSVGRKRVLG